MSQVTEAMKKCPQCSGIAPVQTAVCPTCQHQFRTAFTSTGQAVTPPPVAQAASVFMPDPDQERRSIVMLLIAVFAGIAVMAFVGKVVFDNAKEKGRQRIEMGPSTDDAKK